MFSREHVACNKKDNFRYYVWYTFALYIKIMLKRERTLLMLTQLYLSSLLSEMKGSLLAQSGFEKGRKEYNLESYPLNITCICRQTCCEMTCAMFWIVKEANVLKAENY